MGQVLRDSPPDSWHQAGKHGAHVIQAGGSFYMTYTAHIGPDYHNKRVGLAVADNPAGPFEHVGDGALLPAPPDAPVFDSVGQDDSCVLQRGGEFWWYFKGYGVDSETGRIINNRLCLAIADAPEDPYRRWQGNPVTLTHTGCLWPHGDGIAMISDVVDTSGAHTYPPCIQYSPDGIHFASGGDIQATPSDSEVREAMGLCLKHWGVHLVVSGVYCPEISNAGVGGRGGELGAQPAPGETLCARSGSPPALAIHRAL